jgi:ABC-2 type transport system permease protein
MVAHLVRLRFLILWNGLKKSPWQIVATILGGLYGLFLLGMVIVGLVALSFAPVELTRTVIVLGGAVTIVGWLFGPLIATGIDQTVEPARLVSFPIPLNTLILALTVSGVLGIAGIVTSIAAFGTALSWMNHPLAALAALICAVIAVLTCVVGSRAVIAIGSRVATGRRAREAKAVVVLIPLILLGPIIVWASNLGEAMGTSLPTIAEIVGWTPFGAVWAVPADVAVGAFGPAAAKFVIAVATLAVLFAAWRPALRNAMENPATSTRTKAGKNTAGAFGLFPATPTGAVAARALTYWLRDPRYAQSLIVIPLIPVLAGFYGSITGNLMLINLTGPAVALLLALSIYTDVSYDSTAFALHLQTGVSGVADRVGRIVGLAVFAVPVTLVLTVASVWFSDTWEALPGLLGISIGCLLSGFALSSVVSGRFAFAVPLPGESPFKSRPNGAFALMLSTLGTWGGLALLVLPETILAVVGFVTGNIVWGWASLVVGVVLGSVFLVIGVRWGARILDRRGPEMLVQLHAQK